MTAASHLHDPQALYRNWEHEQWNPWSIELATDSDQWQHALTDADKGLVYWALSSLMVAEERITTKFAGLVMAADSEEEASFLASQQVDEARHMQFYARVQDEVIDQPATIAAHVKRSREELGESFAVIFDQALVSAHQRLAANPSDGAAKVDFITTYHLVIESTLGLTAFEFITRYLRDNQLLPGFVDGYSHIRHDEQRHIGYGVWYLREAARDPALADRIRGKLRELLPAVANALAPPDRQNTEWEALGATSAEIRELRARRAHSRAQRDLRAARHALTPNAVVGDILVTVANPAVNRPNESRPSPRSPPAIPVALVAAPAHHESVIRSSLTAAARQRPSGRTGKRGTK